MTPAPGVAAAPQTGATLPDPPRITTRAVVAGAGLSIFLCAMNSYLTLSFGVIEEGPTIAALFFFAFFFLSKTAITTTEMVIVSTMGSAGGSLGFISNFYAAKAMTGESYTLLEMTGFSIVTSLLGMLFVIPLRELLILKANLPWPGSKAVHAVITALVAGGDRKQPLHLLVSVVLLFIWVVGNNDGGFGWFPEGVELPFFGLAAYGAGVSFSPFATGGSYLMGMRTCVGFLLGGVTLLVMAPHLPDPSAPHRYVWPGIGFLLSSGLTLMVLNWRVLKEAMVSLVSLRPPEEGEDAILRARGLGIMAAVALTVTGLFSVFVMGLSFPVVLVLIVLGGFVQNVIATRAAAQTAFNPARVMGVLLQGVCAALGARSAPENLAGAGFVAGSGAQAGVLTGDLVYGRWLKVPARWQYWTQMITIIPCSLVSAFVFLRIHERTPLMLDGGQLPAPVAKIWAASAILFEGRTQMPPMALESGALAAVLAIFYVLAEEKTPLGKWLPSSTGLGIGLVLPVSYDFSFFLGGFVMWIVLARWLKVRDITLTTVAVSCIVAEGLGGVTKPILQLLGIIGPPG